MAKVVAPHLWGRTPMFGIDCSSSIARSNEASQLQESLDMVKNIQHAPSTEISVSLTSFADFLFKTGKPQLTLVRQIFEQYKRGYSPSLDYYKSFRENVSAFVSGRIKMSELDTVLRSGAFPESKLRNYEALFRGFARFWARNFQEQAYVSIEPPKAVWTYAGVTVRVNPELVVAHGPYTYYIKLYNKKDPLKKKQLDVALHLMQMAIGRPTAQPVVAVLDVRRGRLFEEVGFDRNLTFLLEAEALGFARLWAAAQEIDPPDHSS